MAYIALFVDSIDFENTEYKQFKITVMIVLTRSHNPLPGHVSSNVAALRIIRAKYGGIRDSRVDRLTNYHEMPSIVSNFHMLFIVRDTFCHFCDGVF